MVTMSDAEDDTPAFQEEESPEADSQPVCDQSDLTIPENGTPTAAQHSIDDQKHGGSLVQLVSCTSDEQFQSLNAEADSQLLCEQSTHNNLPIESLCNDDKHSSNLKNGDTDVHDMPSCTDNIKVNLNEVSSCEGTAQSMVSIDSLPDAEYQPSRIMASTDKMYGTSNSLISVDNQEQLLSQGASDASEKEEQYSYSEDGTLIPDTTLCKQQTNISSADECHSHREIIPDSNFLLGNLDGDHIISHNEIAARQVVEISENSLLEIERTEDDTDEELELSPPEEDFNSYVIGQSSHSSQGQYSPIMDSASEPFEPECDQVNDVQCNDNEGSNHVLDNETAANGDVLPSRLKESTCSIQSRPRDNCNYEMEDQGFIQVSETMNTSNHVPNRGNGELNATKHEGVPKEDAVKTVLSYSNFDDVDLISEDNGQLAQTNTSILNEEELPSPSQGANVMDSNSDSDSDSSEDTNLTEDDLGTKYKQISGTHRLNSLMTGNVDVNSTLITEDSTLLRDTKTVSAAGSVHQDVSYNNDNEEQLLSELDAELDFNITPPQLVNSASLSSVLPNGLKSCVSVKEFPEYKQLLAKVDLLDEKLNSKTEIIKQLRAKNDELSSQMDVVVQERNKFFAQVQSYKSKSSDEIYLANIKELENNLVQFQKEVRFYKEKLASHDTAAKQAILKLKGELDQSDRKASDAVKEKDTMVVKYAQSESKILELRKVLDRLELMFRDVNKEKEALAGILRTTKAEKQKLGDAYDVKRTDLFAFQKELEKQKELVSSQDVRVKWAQNKLRAELDAHKETKAKQEDTARKLAEAKEETEIIRRDCQAMIKTYQESEEIKSNSLDIELRKKKTELQLFEQEKSDVEEIHEMTKRELDSLKCHHKDLMEKAKTLNDNVRAHEEERLTNESTMNKFREIMQSQKRTIRESQDKVKELETKRDELERKVSQMNSLQAQMNDVQQTDQELQQDIASCRDRETEMLELTKRMTVKNAQLQSENTGLSAKVRALYTEKESLQNKCSSLEESLKSLSSDFTKDQESGQHQVEELTEKLREKMQAMEALTLSLEEETDQNRTLKRKHAANVKELTRELQLVRRKLENYENQSDNRSALSAGSRTSSTGSLDTVPNSNHLPPPVARQPPVPEPAVQDINDMLEIQVRQPDRQKLIEKVVRLQKAHARKNEKLEFLEDHIKQLHEELKRKHNLVQHYVLREESGALAPESMDENKAQLSRKGGVMASVYHSHATDSHMTLELSLQINHKLQAVLEDTLLKNITLKESIDTLGTEISRLSQENRKLQLEFQEKKQKNQD